jgi:hypothetical protein
MADMSAWHLNMLLRAQGNYLTLTPVAAPWLLAGLAAGCWMLDANRPDAMRDGDRQTTGTRLRRPKKGPEARCSTRLGLERVPTSSFASDQPERAQWGCGVGRAALGLGLQTRVPGAARDFGANPVHLWIDLLEVAHSLSRR